MRCGKNSEIVSLVGDLTWESAPRLRSRLGDLIDHGVRKVVVNMAAVDFVDSSGLAVLLSANRRLRGQGGALSLVDVSEPIMRVLRQARMCEILPARGKDSGRHDRILTTPSERPTMVKSVSVPADASQMTQTRKAISALYQSLGLGDKDVFDLTLAFGEALGNAFDHGCKDASAGDMVTASVALYDDRVVTEVTDCGCGCKFEQGDALPQPTELRGRGIRLMMMLADGVSIEPKTAGHGTKVRLVKMLGDTQECA